MVWFTKQQQPQQQKTQKKPPKKQYSGEQEALINAKKGFKVVKSGGLVSGPNCL